MATAKPNATVMTKVIHHGRNGRFLSYIDYKGVYYPDHIPNVGNHFERMQKIQVSTTDILISSYPRSGLHWIWEIVQMLQHKTTEPLPEFMEDSFLDVHTPERFESRPPPRTFVSHLCYNKIPKSFKEQRCKIIYISRDPRAVAVSYWRYLNNIKGACTLNFEEFVQYFLKGQVIFNGWTEHIASWNKVLQEKIGQHPFLVLHYAEVKEDTFSTVLRLNEFLGTGLSREMCASIARNTHIDKLRESKMASQTKGYKKYFREDQYPMYCEGKVEGWKNTLTVAQNEEFKDKYNSTIRNCKFTVKSLL